MRETERETEVKKGDGSKRFFCDNVYCLRKCSDFFFAESLEFETTEPFLLINENILEKVIESNNVKIMMVGEDVR